MKKKRLSKYSLVILVFIFVFTSQCFSYEAKADVNIPNIEIQTIAEKTTARVDEEVTIKYKITPEPIEINKINRTNKKEIVLVVDTSGSMAQKLTNNETRIQALKKAAKAFVEKFKDANDVSIGIVSYDFSAKGIIGLTSSQNQSSLKSAIDRLVANGATNIGDGIRCGINLFTNNNDNVKKYMILMSDGMPTSLSYKNYAHGYNKDYERIVYDDENRNINSYWLPKDLEEGDYSWQYYDINDNDYIRYGTYGNSDPKGLCLKYSTLMAQRSREKNISNYVIGFSGGSDGNKLNQIAVSGGGAYYNAQDSQAINNVYLNIADEIKSAYIVDNVSLQISLPQNIELSENNQGIIKSNNNYIKSIQNIKYELDTTNKQYVAKPIEISLNVKGKKSGEYTLGGQNIALVYKDINKKEVRNNTSEVKLNITKFNIEFEVSRQLIPGGDSGNFNINDEFEIEYTIKPTPINIEMSKKPKEIMLVVDTSGSMQWEINSRNWGWPSRMHLTKLALKNFVDKFKDRDDVKIGLTAYTAQSKIYNFEKYRFENDNLNVGSNPRYFIEANKVTELYSAINQLEAGGATNIGEGLRKGAGALALNKGAKKYLVVMSDGEPTTYTGINYADEFYTDISLENDKGIFYVNNANQGLEYAKAIGQQIKDNKELDIKTFAIGFSTEANSNKLKEIAESAEGRYEDATANDRNVINNVYMEVADKIKADFTLDNIVLNETLGRGLIIDENKSTSITKNLKINYTYNNQNKAYESDPVKLKIKVKASEIGNYDLIGDAKITYKDLDGKEFTNQFGDLKVVVGDDYIIKQGLFQKGSNEKGVYPGENNIKYIDTLDTIKDTVVRMGVFIRTNGQATDVKIDINKNQNKDIEKIENVEVNVYKVDENGVMTLVAPKNIKIDNKNNYASINIPLAKEGRNKYSYYVINYNFSAATSNESSKMINSCSIEAVKRICDFNINFKKLPDVF